MYSANNSNISTQSRQVSTGATHSTGSAYPKDYLPNSQFVYTSQNGAKIPQVYEPLQSFDVVAFKDHLNPMTYQEKSTIGMTFLSTLPPEDRLHGLTYLHELNKAVLAEQGQNFLDIARSRSGTFITRAANDKVTHLYDY